MAESPESLFPTSLLLSCAKHVQCMCIITVCPSASLPPLVVVVALLLTALIWSSEEALKGCLTLFFPPRERVLCWLCCVSSSDHRVHNHQRQQHWLVVVLQMRSCVPSLSLFLSLLLSVVPFVHSLSLRRLLLLLLQHRSHPRWRLQKRVISSSRLRLMVVVVVVHCTVLSVYVNCKRRRS